MSSEKNEGVNRESNVNWNDKNADSDMNQYDHLSDKWNDIQHNYIEKYPEVDTEDLYFDSGGFEGVIEKISKIRGKSVDEIRSEILNW